MGRYPFCSRNSRIISTIKGEKSFTDEAKNDGFYRLVNAQFVGFLVDKESKES
jgi:hypothetical protein